MEALFMKFNSDKPHLKHWATFDSLLQYNLFTIWYPVRLDNSGSWKPEWKSKLAVVKKRKFLNAPTQGSDAIRMVL